MIAFSSVGLSPMGGGHSTVDVMSKDIEFCRFIKLSVRQPKVPDAQASCTLRGRTQKPLICFLLKLHCCAVVVTQPHLLVALNLSLKTADKDVLCRLVFYLSLGC